MSQHFVSDKECGTDSFAEIDKSKILFRNLCVDFFRVSKAGCIIQDVDEKSEKFRCISPTKSFSGRFRVVAKDLVLSESIMAGTTMHISKELFLPNPSEHSLFYVIPAQGNVGFR